MPADSEPQDPNERPVAFKHADGTSATPQADANDNLNVNLNASVGASVARITTANGTAQAVKASAGTVYGVQAINTSAAIAYVQIFNLAAASVTMGTTAPALEILVPVTSGFVNLNLSAIGVAFGTAISVGSATAEGGGTGSASGVTVYVEYI